MSQTFLISYTLILSNEKIECTTRVKNKDSELQAKIHLEIYLKRKYPDFRKLVVSNFRNEKTKNKIIMKKLNRVECDQCQNFISPDFKISFNLIKLTKDEKAACKLGKRVMFRINKGSDPMNPDCGYFRYCDEFKSTK